MTNTPGGGGEGNITAGLALAGSRVNSLRSFVLLFSLFDETFTLLSVIVLACSFS